MKAGDHAEGPARAREAHVEAPADDRRVGEGPGDGRHGPLRQHGVGVQEQERVAPRHPRARVHLARPPARARDEADGGKAPHHLGGCVRAAAVDDDDLLLGTAGDEVGQEPLEIRRLVERGHDDAQHPIHAAQRVQASQRAKSRFTRGVRRVRL